MSVIKKVFTFEIFMVVIVFLSIAYFSAIEKGNELSLIKLVSTSPEMWSEMIPLGKVVGYEFHEVARSSHPAHQGIKDKFDKLKLSSTSSEFILMQGNRFSIGEEIRMASKNGVLVLCMNPEDKMHLYCKVAKKER